MTNLNHGLPFWAAISLVLMAFAGCNRGVPTLQDVKDVVRPPIERVEPDAEDSSDDRLPQPVEPDVNPGLIEIALDQPLRIEACVAHVDRLPATRPSILRLTSYESPEKESFPSVCILAEIASADPAGLIGAKVRAQVFVQVARELGTWFTPHGDHAELEIVSAAGGRIAGRFVSGRLSNADDGRNLPLSGAFEGSLDEP